MRRFWIRAAIALGAALLGSATTAGGILCMLHGRNVTYGQLVAAPREGVCAVQAADGVKQLRLGPNTKIVRIERVPAGEVRAGEQFVARNANDGGASPAVVLFGSQEDLFTLYNAVGHGTRRGQVASRR